MRYEYLLRLAAFILAAGSSLLPADEPDFASQVAPILRQHCVRCHNDDERSGGLSLHTAKDLVAAGHLGTTNAVTSPLIKQITPVDGEAAMPQDAPPLTAEQIAIITKWLDAGAAWPSDVRIEIPRVTDFDWWSYRPLQLPAVPERSDDWVRTPIDAFVLEELQTRGLSPTKEADRRTLIRRVSYDLTGLPPTPEETQAFINNSDPQAYEQLVDRLLDSKHYGERWARHWLDVVKYADTCGYDKDKLRPQAWPYRDYVIDSFNEDKPYSQFVQEQIAGDALFPGQPDGILGLGFIAAGPWDFIGHVEVSESKIDGKVARNLDRDDMVANAINTFCSVTVQCARCHHHKFDPITQQDYYGLQAVFAAVDRANRPYDLDPATETERRSLESQLAETLASQRELEQAIASEGGDQLAKLNAELQRLAKDTKVEKDQAFGYHSAIASRSDAEKWVQVDLGDAHEVAKIVLRPCHDDFAGIGSGFGFPKRFRIDTSLDAKEWVTIHDQTEHDFDASDLAPCEVSALAVEARYVRVTATKLSERKNDFILALAELAVLDQDQALLSKQATVTALDSIEAPVRWARRNLTDGKWADWTSPERGQQLATAKRQRKELLQRIETPARVERRQTLEQKIQQTRQAIEKLPKGKLVYAAATDFSPQGNFKPTQGTPRAVHVLHRGDVQHPRAMAQPGVLPLPGQDRKIDADASESQRRAALAKWLVDDAHPLVWRSIVNRIWQYHFGQGIVATPNDFGRMGALPTHPQLLDWLAIQFRDGGQSFKALHRMMVTSSVYRQASTANPTNQAIDGGNQYLWRMNRRRLSAEEIRDSILLVSGALDRKMGGPGFYLFELEKTAHSPHYEYHKFDPRDPASHRRSIYRFIVRSQPDPWMTTLDCADSSQSTPRRNETLTSLQALSLLNNPFNLVMAETFAEHLKATEDRLPAQVDRAVEQTLQRTTEAEERQAMIDYAQTHGLENLCRLLFNLSEFVFVD